MIWVWFRGPQKTLEPQVPKPLLSAPISHARSLECVHGPQGSWPSPHLCTQPGDHRQWLDLQGPVDNIAHDQQHHTVLEGSRGVGTEMGEEGQGGKWEQARVGWCPHPHQRNARRGRRRAWRARQVPHRAARCTAGCSLCRARGGCDGKSLSLQGEGKVPFVTHSPGLCQLRGTRAFGGHSYAKASSNFSPSDSSRPPVRGQNPKVSCDPGPQGHQALMPWGPAGPLPMPCPGHALTQLPAAHVIELYAEEQSGHDVNHGEDNPERCVPFAKHLPGATQDRAEEALQQAAPLARPSSSRARLLLSRARESTLGRSRISPARGREGVCARACECTYTFPTEQAEWGRASPHPAQKRR